MREENVLAVPQLGGDSNLFSWIFDRRNSTWSFVAILEKRLGNGIGELILSKERVFVLGIYLDRVGTLKFLERDGTGLHVN